MQNIITIYSNAVPMPSKNVRNAMRILNNIDWKIADLSPCFDTFPMFFSLILTLFQGYFGLILTLFQDFIVKITIWNLALEPFHKFL